MRWLLDEQFDLIHDKLNRLQEGVDLMSDQQGEITTDLDEINAGLDTLQSEFQAQIDALTAQHPGVDLSGLGALVSRIGTLVADHAAPTVEAPVVDPPVVPPVV